jgi:hypothetical protein
MNKVTLGVCESDNVQNTYGIRVKRDTIVLIVPEAPIRDGGGSGEIRQCRVIGFDDLDRVIISTPIGIDEIWGYGFGAKNSNHAQVRIACGYDIRNCQDFLAKLQKVLIPDISRFEEQFEAQSGLPNYATVVKDVANLSGRIGDIYIQTGLTVQEVKKQSQRIDNFEKSLIAMERMVTAHESTFEKLRKPKSPRRKREKGR